LNHVIPSNTEFHVSTLHFRTKQGYIAFQLLKQVLFFSEHAPGRLKYNNSHYLYKKLAKIFILRKWSQIQLF